jgi:hypothetical protein
MTIQKPTYSKNMVQDWGLSKSTFDGIFRMCRIQAATEDFQDPTTGETSATQMAEYVAERMGRIEWLDDETHPLWDIAAYLAEHHDHVSYPLRRE